MAICYCEHMKAQRTTEETEQRPALLLLRRPMFADAAPEQSRLRRARDLKWTESGPRRLTSRSRVERKS